MGQTQSPVGSPSQSLLENALATASAGGTATFSFPAPPTGWSWTGTLTCPSAPTTAVFTASVSGAAWGSFVGNSVGGPVQCYAGQLLTVTATGLTAGTQYLLVWNGSSDSGSIVQPIYPDVTSSAVLAAITQTLAVQGQVDNLMSGSSQTTNASGILTLTFTAKHAYNSLSVTLTGWADTPVCFSVTNAENQIWVAPFAPEFTGLRPYMQATAPLTCASGDTLTVTIYTITALTALTVSVNAMTTGPVPPVRSDGRVFPLGSAVAVSTVAAAAGALRYMLKSVEVYAHMGGAATTGVKAWFAQGVIGGVTRTLCGAAGQTQGNSLSSNAVSWESGLLLDPATAITISSFLIGTAPTSDGSTVTVAYDTVV